MKRIISHILFKKRKEQKKKQTWQREKAEDVFSNLLDEKQHFFRYTTTGKQKMRTFETIFQDTEKQDKSRKNVKHVQQTKEAHKIVFVVTKQKKKV